MNILDKTLLDKINPKTFGCLFQEIIKMDWESMIEVGLVVTEDQFYRLQPYILDEFVSDVFEQAEWEGRFRLFEKAKEIYARDMFGGDTDFVRMKLSNYQDVFICKDYNSDTNDTLVISTELFHTTNLAPMEIIVYTLKQEWNKSYATISKMLNRHPNTINETFKRAVVKMELM